MGQQQAEGDRQSDTHQQDAKDDPSARRPHSRTQYAPAGPPRHPSSPVSTYPSVSSFVPPESSHPELRVSKWSSPSTQR